MFSVCADTHSPELDCPGEYTNQMSPYSSLDITLLQSEGYAAQLFSQPCSNGQQTLCPVLSEGRWIHLICPHWFWCNTIAFCATSKKMVRRHLDFLTMVTCHMSNLKICFFVGYMHCLLFLAIMAIFMFWDFPIFHLADLPPFPMKLCFSWLAASAICPYSLEVSRREKRSFTVPQGPLSPRGKCKAI